MISWKDLYLEQERRQRQAVDAFQYHILKESGRLPQSTTGRCLGHNLSGSSGRSQILWRRKRAPANSRHGLEKKPRV